MTAGIALGVAGLGALGALARFLVDGAVSARAGRVFPAGTLVVNLSGAFALGVLVGAAVSGDTNRLLGTGFLGGYTTFSTWMFESQRLAEDGRDRSAALNVAVSLIAGVLAAWLGRRVGGGM
jgi:CrcB protein